MRRWTSIKDTYLDYNLPSRGLADDTPKESACRVRKRARKVLVPPVETEELPKWIVVFKELLSDERKNRYLLDIIAGGRIDSSSTTWNQFDFNCCSQIRVLKANEIRGLHGMVSG